MKSKKSTQKRAVADDAPQGSYNAIQRQAREDKAHGRVSSDSGRGNKKKS